MKILHFDVESIGLRGPAFAVGWIAYEDGVERARGWMTTDPYRILQSMPAWQVEALSKDMEWVKEHVISRHYTEDALGSPPRTSYKTPEDLRLAFWTVWKTFKAMGYLLAADVPYPVETSFLEACIADDPARVADAPYPLLDVASMTLAKIGRWDDDGQPVSKRHHPVFDAEFSAARLQRAGVI